MCLTLDLAFLETCRSVTYGQGAAGGKVLCPEPLYIPFFQAVLLLKPHSVFAGLS